MEALSPKCDVLGCGQYAHPDYYRLHCMACHKHLCAKHWEDESHFCQYLTEDEWDQVEGCRRAAMALNLAARLAASNVKAFALSQRPSAKSCTIEIPSRKGTVLMGYTNVNIPIRFNDGTRWLARVRMTGNPENTSPQVQVRSVTSEVATLQFLHNIAPEVVPNAWNPGCAAQDDIRYFLTEFREGCGARYRTADGEVSPLLIKNYASFLVKVAAHPFKGIGSLYPNADAINGAPKVGPLLRTFGKHQGPFQTLRAYYDARVDHSLEELQTGTDPYRLKGRGRVDTYLGLLYLRHLVHNTPETADEQPTFLMHWDHASDIFLLNESGGLTAIIDWEYSGTMPAALAFGCTPFSGAGKKEDLVAEGRLFTELVNLGRQDLALCLEQGRKYSWLNAILGLPASASGPFFDTYLRFFKRTRMAFQDDSHPCPETIEEWRTQMEAMHGNDEGLLRLISLL